MSYYEYKEKRKNFERAPEEKARFDEEVKQRVVMWVDANGMTDLSKKLVRFFWGEHVEYNEFLALEQARRLGIPETELHNRVPYFWYKALKPHVKAMANSAKAYVSYFTKPKESE